MFQKNKRKGQGAVGALLDEYERAIAELKQILGALSQEQFTHEIDKNTPDKDCISIQAIVNHVVRSGYGYCKYIKQQFEGTKNIKVANPNLQTPQEACDGLDTLLAHNEDTVKNLYNLSDDDYTKNIITTPWGQKYDFDQLMEHAVMHVLRHRRQVEIFMSNF